MQQMKNYTGKVYINEADPQHEDIEIRGQKYSLCPLLMEHLEHFTISSTDKLAQQYGWKWIIVKCMKTKRKYIYSTN